MDRIRNERNRGTTKVGEISKKVQESRLTWYGHVSRREDEYVGKRLMGMEVPGKRRRGRPKRRWLDSIRNHLSERGLSEEDAQDRPRWRRLTRHIEPTKKWEKMKKKKKIKDYVKIHKLADKHQMRHIIR